jgi:hypothetical protein
MNIFVLDNDPRLAAIMHCDKHIAKMVLESAQMLCSVINERGGATPYKTTHKNHPCTRWCRASQENFHWLTQHAKELNNQYRKRYGKQVNHKSWEIIKQTVRGNAEIIRSLPDIGPTPFAQAMPEQYKNTNAVTAYRAYYKTKEFAVWGRGVATPYWWG